MIQKSYEITAPNPNAFDSTRVLFFFDSREYHDHFLPILEMCGLKNIDKFDNVGNAINELISSEYDIVILTYLDKAEASCKLVKEARSLAIDIPFVAITEKGIGLKNVLGIYSQGVEEIVWPPLSANKLGKLLQALVQANRNDRFKEAHTKARELLETGEFDEAEIAYKQLLTQNAYRIDASLALSVINVKKDKFNEAKHLLLNAQAYAKSIPNLVKKTYHLSRVIYYMGELYRDQNDMENAVRHYRAALSMNPHLHQANQKLGQIFIDQGNVEELSKLAQETRKTFHPYSQQMSDMATFVETQASHYDDLGMNTKANELYYYLLSYPHANPEVHIKVADYFWRQAQYNVVVTRFDKLKAANIKIAEVLAKHGECLLDIQKHHLEFREDEDPGNPEHGRFHGMRSNTLIDNAKELLQEALLLNQGLQCAWIHLIRSYLRQNEMDTAEDVLKRFMKKADDNEDLLVNVVDALFDEHAYELGYSYVREGMEKYPQAGRLYLFGAQYMRVHKKFYDAVGTLKQGLQVDENNTEMMIQIGDGYMDLGQPADAVTYYEKASHILPADDELKRKLTEALIQKSQSSKKKRPLPLGS